MVLAENYFLPLIFWQFVGCIFGYFFPFFFPFYSYFTAFYGDGSHHFNRLLLGLFFNKVRDFGGGGFGFSVGQES